MEKQLGIEIKGSEFANDKNKDIDELEFFKEFVKFIESRGWSFNGTVFQMDKSGEYK